MGDMERLKELEIEELKSTIGKLKEEVIG